MVFPGENRSVFAAGWGVSGLGDRREKRFPVSWNALTC